MEGFAAGRGAAAAGGHEEGRGSRQRTYKRALSPTAGQPGRGRSIIWTKRLLAAGSRPCRSGPSAAEMPAPPCPRTPTPGRGRRSARSGPRRQVELGGDVRPLRPRLGRRDRRGFGPGAATSRCSADRPGGAAAGRLPLGKARVPVYRLSAQIIGRGSGKSAVAAAAYRAAERLVEAVSAVASAALPFRFGAR